MRLENVKLEAECQRQERLALCAAKVNEAEILMKIGQENLRAAEAHAREATIKEEVAIVTSKVEAEAATERLNAAKASSQRSEEYDKVKLEILKQSLVPTTIPTPVQTTSQKIKSQPKLTKTEQDMIGYVGMWIDMNIEKKDGSSITLEDLVEEAYNKWKDGRGWPSDLAFRTAANKHMGSGIRSGEPDVWHGYKFKDYILASKKLREERDQAK